MIDFFTNTVGLGPTGGYLAGTLAWILAIVLPVLFTVAMIVWMDRKVWAAMQMRKGPNVVGPFGLLQSFADGIKLFLKETIIPAGANRGIFLLAPVITLTLALAAWAVIPIDAGQALADVNVGLLYLFAISSLGVYGIIMSGWASNSKYPFLGGLRSAAQMVSYEVSIGFVIICVVLWAAAWRHGLPADPGEMARLAGCTSPSREAYNLSTLVCAQQGTILGFINANLLNPLLIPMGVVFFISALAETNRPPFDLPEAESELVAGYQVEYSSMSFALFQLGEYANILLMCAMTSLLFLGGWLPPVEWAPLYAVPGWIWFIAKILFVFFLFAWVKATVPRYRYDQLMRLGWKVFLPLSMAWIVLVSGYLMLTGGFGDFGRGA
ncbi:MAG: complex I subunit 1/NuoH family protein [Sphingomonadaceae bacterium]